MLRTAFATAALTAMLATTGWAQASSCPYVMTQYNLWNLLGQNAGPQVEESYLGVYLSEIDADLVEELSLPEERGALISQVVSGSPADKAGLLQEDVVMSYSKVRVESARQLKRLVTETPPGRAVPLSVIRDGGRKKLEVTIGLQEQSDMPRWQQGAPGQDEDERARWQAIPFHGGMPERDAPGRPGWQLPAPEPRARLGVMLQELPDQLAAFFGLEDRSGVLIASVLEDSPAEAAGLRAGDVLLEIDGEAVASPIEVQRAVSRGEGSVELRILRDREETRIEATLPDEEADDEGDGDTPEFPREAM